jgi:AAA ATPase domain
LGGSNDASFGRHATPDAPVPMVDRFRELAELEAALADARTRHGRVMLLSGEPGIGKTRLAEVAAEVGAAKHMLALWGRSWETAGAPAYWPWTQLLRTLISTRDTARLELEVGSGARWLAQVLPELCDLLPGTVASSQASEKARFAIFDAVASFLRRAAASDPLVIVLDDLHAADPASLLLLEFVARGIADSRILLLGTYQEAAARRRPEVEKLIGLLSRETPTISLGGFEEEDLALLVEYRTGGRWSPQLVKALHRATEGNAFFTNELIGLLAVEGEIKPTIDARGEQHFPLPDTVRETVRRRFEPLEAGTIEALEAAAVIGREFRTSTVERVTGEPALDHIDAAASAGLVRPVQGTIDRHRFTHNLIRETLYAELATSRRVDVHRAVGEALEATYGEDPEHYAERAHHFAEAASAGYADKAVEYATKGAREAMRLHAYEQAAGLYQLALDAAELLERDPERRAELMLAMGKARRGADQLGATETLLAAAEAARALDDPRLFAEAALALRAFSREAGFISEQPSAVLSEALERLEGGDPALRARVMARLATCQYYWPDSESRRTELVGEAVALARDQISSLRWVQGRFDKVEGAVRELASHHVFLTWPAALALLQYEKGDRGEARRFLEHLTAEDLRDLPHYNDWLLSMGLLAELCVRLRDEPRARIVYEQLAPYAGYNVITRQATFLGPVSHYLALLATAQDDVDLALEHLEQARDAAARLDSPMVLMRAKLAEADILSKRDQPEDRDGTVELLADVVRIAEELGLERIVEEARERLDALGGAPPAAPAVVADGDVAASLCREGDVWAFGFEGRSVRVRDGRGVRHLAVLLANPGVEVHALELASPQGSVESGSASRGDASLQVPADDAGPALDAEAKQAYRRRVEELRDEIEEAESFNDPERAAHAREEMEFLAGELTAAVGLGGRDRKTASSAERARVSVTKAIRALIKRVGDHDAALGRELEATVRTGTFCAFEPDPRRPTDWRVETG